ncbi:MAG: NAD(P)(+) transhydrogenase (Re/Si-specific) subunit beta, partial [Rhodospirillaceae bacterium]|nr:NAD(P)(+) transhydrogenase (Re/Si-specific) subunit beta [Rhodospirillaceae bacterium]
MTSSMSAFAYLIASVLFIMALRGLSHPESARRGNMFGMIGMAIAIITTLVDPDVVGYDVILAGLVVGGSIGTIVALKIKMTALPQLVAAFHSLVGLAAVLVASAALFNPTAYGLGAVGAIPAASLVEMGLGTAIGAVTFSGSLIAFAKLQGIMSGTPITFMGQHKLNALLGITMAVLFFMFATTES